MKVINLIDIRPNKRVLLVKKKKGEVWIFPGGKLEAGESDKECLERECAEELSGTEIEIGELFGQFEGTTPNSGKPVTAKAFFGRVLDEKPAASAELMDAALVTYRQAIDLLNLSTMTCEIVHLLHERNLI